MTESNFSEYAIMLGRIQNDAEALLYPDRVPYLRTTKGIRELVLPMCTRNNLNCDAFEYLAKYLCKKYADDYKE